MYNFLQNLGGPFRYNKYNITSSKQIRIKTNAEILLPQIVLMFGRMMNLEVFLLNVMHQVYIAWV